MTVLSALDAAGAPSLAAPAAGFTPADRRATRGSAYPADPPTVDEIVAVMRHTADERHGWRVRAMIVGLWRAGLRIQEALTLAEHDLDHRRGSILVRSGKGGRRREVGMDEWGWEQLQPWLAARAELPVGPLLCIIDGPTRPAGPRWSGAPCAASSAGSPPAPASGGGSRRTSCVTRKRSSSPVAGRAAEHHSAPARPRQPRHHLDLPPRHPPGRDHRGGAHTPRADDVRQRRDSGSERTRGERERHRALPGLRPGEASAGAA